MPVSPWLQRLCTQCSNHMGDLKSYNPKNKGKKRFQPTLTFAAETKARRPRCVQS